MSKSKVVVIDLSNLAYIALYGYTHNKPVNYSSKAFTAICRNKIAAIQRITKATKLIFAKDNYPKRKELDADYKANRHKCEYPIKKDLIHFLLKNKYEIYESKDKEADDVMATLIKANKADVICTTDQDLLQVIDTGKQLFNPVTNQYWDKSKLNAKYKLKLFKDVLWYKAFFGDGSDNIPRSGDRLPRKDITNIINKHRFKNWKQLREQLKTYKFYDKIDFKRLKLNYKIVKIDTNCKIKRTKK